MVPVIQSCSLSSNPALNLIQCEVWSSNIRLKACAVGSPTFLLSIFISSNELANNMLRTPLRKHRGGTLTMLILWINTQIQVWFPKCQLLLSSELHLLWLAITQSCNYILKAYPPRPSQDCCQSSSCKGNSFLSLSEPHRPWVLKRLQQFDFQRLNCVGLEFFMHGPWLHLTIWCEVLITGESRE